MTIDVGVKKPKTRDECLPSVRVRTDIRTDVVEKSFIFGYEKIFSLFSPEKKGLTVDSGWILPFLFKICKYKTLWNIFKAKLPGFRNNVSRVGLGLIGLDCFRAILGSVIQDEISRDVTSKTRLT